MMTVLCMVILLVFMAYLLLWDTRAMNSSAHFYNNANTSVLRGFWSLVVILVHVPASVQNALQDMIGSFAYIGVTFFFMTSAYGLKKNVMSHGVKGFWKRRLPKLFVPMLVVNIVTAAISVMIMPEQVSFHWLTDMDSWVRWLLVCYFLFWVIYRYGCFKHKDILIGIGIVLFSLYQYIVLSDGWPTEIYGFIWGLLLANGKLFKTEDIATKRWLFLCTIFVAASGALGIAYLRFKPVLFWGDYLLKIFLGVTILCLLLCINKRLSFGNRVAMWLGSISYEIYLTHGTVMWWLLSLKEDWTSGVFIVLTVVLTIALSALEHKISRYILGHLSCWKRS